MTLGGLALAVGILVDDATVEIENIHRNMAQKKPIVQAILDGAPQIAAPAFVVDALHLHRLRAGRRSSPARRKSLFMPLAMAVVFAMLTSYFLSRTLVPTMVHYLLAQEVGAPRRRSTTRRRRSLAARSSRAFERGFERLRTFYGGWLAWALEHRRAGRRRRSSCFVVGVARALPPGRARLLPQRRRRAHQAPRARRRRARASRRPSSAFARDRGHDPHASSRRREIETMLDNIGIAVQRHQPVAQRGRADLVGRRRDPHRAQGGPRARRPSYVRKLRATLAATFPEHDVLLPRAGHLDAGAQLRARRRPSTCRSSGPLGNDDADLRGRAAARRRGSSRSPAPSTSTSRRSASSPSSASTSTARWPASSASPSATSRTTSLVSLRVERAAWRRTSGSTSDGVQYLVAVQTPQYEIDSIDALDDHAHLDRRRPRRSCSSNLAAVSRTDGPGEHHPLQRRRAPTTSRPTSTGTDLGSVADAVDRRSSPTMQADAAARDDGA